MTFVTDCKYNEELTKRLETTAKELFAPSFRESSVDPLLLAKNAKAMNDAITKYKKSRDDVIRSRALTRDTKTKFAEKYVPKEIASLFNETPMTGVNDLIKFVADERNNFLPTFVSDSDVIEAIGFIDPVQYPTFTNEYPSIDSRIETGPITSAEVSDMLATNNLSPYSFETFVTNSPKGAMSTLERFLANLGIGASMMGSFCSLVENVFALVNGQKDVFNNATGFSPDFERLVSSINPEVGQILSQVSDITVLLNKAKTDTGDVKQNMQNAFSLISSAFGLIMNFYDPETGTGGNVDVDWDLLKVKAAITPSAPRFLTIVESTQKPLGDINQDGVISSTDTELFQDYINSANNVPSEVVDYIDNTMFRYMADNLNSYADLVNFPGDTTSPSFQDTLVKLSAAVSLFGSPSSPGSGDFGMSSITQMISQVSTLGAAVQTLVGGGAPNDITRITSVLSQIAQVAEVAMQTMYTDLNATTAELESTTADALTEAENVAVEDPAKAAEISQNNQDALKENVSVALATVGENTKTLGPKLTRALNTVAKGASSLAAVGVLDSVKSQLESVVEQSSQQLQATLAAFSVESISNGFNANMSSSFSKMASLRANAQIAASEETTQQMREVVAGQVTTAADRFRERNKEEVDFIALRFCKLASEIERIYSSVTDPLKSMQGSFDSASSSLGASSSPITLAAMRAGATRFDTQTRMAAMESAGQVPATLARRYVDPGTGAITTVPPQGSIPQPSNGSLPVVPPNFFQFPSFEEAQRGALGVLYAPGSSSSLSGRAGFTPKSIGGGVHTETMARLYWLASRWGRTITVISAYRNDAANESAGGATGSQHLAGTAFDCDINSYDEQIAFANIAYQVGFRGIGSYLGGNTFIHIDTGSQRDWAQGGFEYYNLPGPAGAKSRG